MRTQFTNYVIKAREVSLDTRKRINFIGHIHLAIYSARKQGSCFGESKQISEENKAFRPAAIHYLVLAVSKLSLTNTYFSVEAKDTIL